MEVGSSSLDFELYKGGLWTLIRLSLHGEKLHCLTIKEGEDHQLCSSLSLRISIAKLSEFSFLPVMFLFFCYVGHWKASNLSSTMLSETTTHFPHCLFVMTCLQQVGL